MSFFLLASTAISSGVFRILVRGQRLSALGAKGAQCGGCGRGFPLLLGAGSGEACVPPQKILQFSV